MANNVFTKLMSMNEETWQRHANPASVWSRIITGLPTILGAIWCVKPLGWKSAPIIIVVFFWLWLNPRVFSIPSHTDNWASKLTFGERIWLNRSEISIPKHHASWALFLSILAGAGFLVAIVGAYKNLVLPTVVGGVISWFGKMWFCDRMVWLYEDMKNTHEQYNSWLKK